MKVIDLLAKTNQKVREYNLRQLPATHGQPSSRSDIANRLIAIEERLSWLTLIGLFKNTGVAITTANLQPFINFLADRWARIKDIYQLTYPKKYNHPLTLACASLARELATIEYDGKLYHHFELLMPTIKIYNESLLMSLIDLDAMAEENSINEATQQSREHLKISDNSPLFPKGLDVARLAGLDASEKEKIQLHHFILDHWGYVINIKDCIDNAVRDGILKHPSALETVINEAGLVPGYVFRLMPRHFERHKQKTPRGVLYIGFGMDFFRYAATGMTTFGVITAKELNISMRPLTLKILEPYQADILERISKVGHIQIQKQPRTFLPKEEFRIIYSSMEGNKRYRAMTAVVREKDKASNAVEAIKNLIKYLDEGGKRGKKGGSENVSGLSSYIGIRKFYDFTQSISNGKDDSDSDDGSDNDFETLMQASVIYNQGSVYSLQLIWCELLATAIDSEECHFSEEERTNIFSKLLVSHFTTVATKGEKIKEKNPRLDKKRLLALIRENRPILCSEEFARKLTDILRANPDLIKIRPKIYVNAQGSVDEAKQKQQQLEDACEQTLKKFTTAIHENKLTHYSEMDNEISSDEIRDALADPVATEKFTQSLVTSMDNFIFLLVGLPPEHHEHVVADLLTRKFLQNLINTSEKIVALFKGMALDPRLNLENTSRVILSVLSREFLQKTVTDKHSIDTLKLVLPSKSYQDFFLPKPGSPQKINFGFLRPPEAIPTPLPILDQPLSLRP